MLSKKKTKTAMALVNIHGFLSVKSWGKSKIKH